MVEVLSYVALYCDVTSSHTHSQVSFTKPGYISALNVYVKFRQAEFYRCFYTCSMFFFISPQLFMLENI